MSDEETIDVRLTVRTVEAMRRMDAGPGTGTSKYHQWCRDLVEHNPLPSPLTRGDIVTHFRGPDRWVVVGLMTDLNKILVVAPRGWDCARSKSFKRVDPDTIDPAERAALLRCAFITEDGE